jgi:CHAD domain-containing protein
MSHTPISLAYEHLKELAKTVPGVRDGDPDAIHDTRVATRRLREVLPLLGDGVAIQRAERVFREVGSTLGRTRDIDVLLELLRDAGRRLPQTAGLIASIELEHESDRARKLRRVVKRMDKLDLSRILGEFQARGVQPVLGRSRRPGWSRTLSERVGDRAAKLHAAVHHAGGVEFPNRLHRVRIATKKLRYTVEAAQGLGLLTLPGAEDTLRASQKTLGGLHDRHVLLDQLGARLADERDRASVDMLCAYFTLDARELHKVYLEERTALVAVAEQARLAALVAARPRLSAARVAVAALAVAPLTVMLRRVR